jgi:TonB family protein
MLLLALLLLGQTGCNLPPQEFADDIPRLDLALELNMNHSSRFWSDNFDRAADRLFQRTSLLMDDPIRLLGYRPRPAAQGLEGQVVMRFAISPSGIPVDPRLLRVQGASMQRPRLGQITLEAVQNWRFSTPMRNGEPTRFCCVQLVMDYTRTP